MSSAGGWRSVAECAPQHLECVYSSKHCQHHYSTRRCFDGRCFGLLARTPAALIIRGPRTGRYCSRAATAASPSPPPGRVGLCAGAFFRRACTNALCGRARLLSCPLPFRPPSSRRTPSTAACPCTSPSNSPRSRPARRPAASAPSPPRPAAGRILWPAAAFDQAGP